MSTRSTLCCARTADQTTYALRDRPREIRITHPPHPLFGQRLKVLQPRREGGETFWIAGLADGSRIRMPSRWTDHPVDGAPVPRFRSGARVTPQALRELTELLSQLASAPAVPDARPGYRRKGDRDERTAVSLRAAPA
ncbi:MAG: hypothetical protein IH936_06925 [Acidobacteria bacterium]|nr:hypothetical protein [Acidobacteriota bacterium]